MSFNNDNSIPSRTCPCRWCQDREVGCHAKCQRYEKWKLLLGLMKEDNKELRTIDIINRANLRKTWKKMRWQNQQKPKGRR